MQTKTRDEHTLPGSAWTEMWEWSENGHSLAVLRSEDGMTWACTCREWLGSNTPLERRPDCRHISRRKAEVVCHLAEKHQVLEDEIIQLIIDGRVTGLGLRTTTTGTLTPWARPMSRFASIAEGVT